MRGGYAETMRSAIVLGASGLVGSELLALLLARDEWQQITVLTRRKLPLQHAKLRQQVMDLEKTERPVLLPADDLFCAIGTTIRKAGSQEAFRRVDYEVPLRAAKALTQARLSRMMLVSSVGADAQSGTFYLRTKGEVEEALGKLPVGALHVFRPSVLLGNRQEFRPAERVSMIALQALGPLLLGGLAKYRAIPAATVARAMVAAALGAQFGRNVHEYEAILAMARRLR